MTKTFETQVLEALNDLVRKVSRLETRVMALADELGINVTITRKLKEKNHENIQ